MLLDDFKTALILLDHHLIMNPSVENMEIRAIGGFAMLYHNMRQNGYTADIDSLTVDWDTQQLILIERVASTLDLPSDWLNNYNVLDNDLETVENMIEPFWEFVDWNFKRIILKVADVETLMRSKLIASEDYPLTQRVQDFPDLLDILKRLNLHSTQEFRSFLEELDIDLDLEYPFVAEKLIEQEKAGVFTDSLQFSEQL